MPGEPTFEQLDGVVQLIDRGEDQRAQQLLRDVLARVDTARDPSAIKFYIFGSALAERLAPQMSREANLYLTDYDVPQIHLFNLLGREVPLVYASSALANAVIARHLERIERPTIIDIGIGTGRQLLALLDELATRGRVPRSLHVVGIEPMGWALEQAGRSLHEAAHRHGVDLAFDGIHGVIEEITREQWYALARRHDRPVINASFALHHISDVGGRDVRDEVLQRLRWLEPAAVVLSEPHADHLERELPRRFRNCWEHFGAAFRVLDRLPLADRDRAALKVCFFGREIVDVLGKDDAVRSERHETTESWTQRLARAGFRAADTGADAIEAPVIEVSRSHGVVRLGHEGTTIVSILCATPDSATGLPEGFAARTPTAARIAVPPLEIQLYLAVLRKIAEADGVVHDRERAFIAEQARILGVALEDVPTADSVDMLLHGHAVNERTRDAIVRDLVFLAGIDGTYSSVERDTLRALADQLGCDPGRFTELENRTMRATGPGLDVPGWFQEYWFMAGKR